MVSLADPDLELSGERGGRGGFYLLALLAFLPSVISCFTQNKGEPVPPLDLPLGMTKSE